MDERAALDLVGGLVSTAGDDAAVVDGIVVTTDMLHDETDFPDGTTRYTAGWRAVGASLSDVAAMGAVADAAVAVYAAPQFDETELRPFVEGAIDVCAAVDCEYVGGDLDQHREFTVASTAVGSTEDPVERSGATPGDRLCVTGRLGRTAAAIELFDRGDDRRANERFQFVPRVAAGRALATHATAIMDSSDGLARSLHQLAGASDCGFAVDADAVPVDGVLVDLVDPVTALDRAVAFGEDFELVVTIPPERLDSARETCPVELTPIGRVVPADRGVSMDGEPLADRGYTHGESES